MQTLLLSLRRAVASELPTAISCACTSAYESRAQSHSISDASARARLPKCRPSAIMRVSMLAKTRTRDMISCRRQAGSGTCMMLIKSTRQLALSLNSVCDDCIQASAHPSSRPAQVPVAASTAAHYAALLDEHNTVRVGTNFSR
jgi:hypothetical protein